jgi:hypothetical protein
MNISDLLKRRIASRFTVERLQQRRPVPLRPVQAISAFETALFATPMISDWKR